MTFSHFVREIGKKEYELKDHLGNVRVTISDIKNVDANNQFAVDLRAFYNYYPFGMIHPNSSLTGLWEGTNKEHAYRFGYNGVEKDNELKGTGNSLTTDFRMFDPRLGRWWSIDPIRHEWESPYAGFGNNPIAFSDPSGAEPGKEPKEGGQTGTVVVTGDKTGSDNTDGTVAMRDVQFNFAPSASASIQSVDRNLIISTYSGGLPNLSHGIDPPLQGFNNGDLLHQPMPGDINWHTAVYLSNPNGEIYAKSIFSTIFRLGIGFNQGDGEKILTHFLYGNGSALPFPCNSEMSARVADNPVFQEFANKFEQMAINYYSQNGKIDGFNTITALNKRPESFSITNFFGTNLFTNTVMGGYQQMEATITQISKNSISVMYTIHDHFGVGLDDASRSIPGLAEMYVLEHYYSDGKTKYMPYKWSVDIYRSRDFKK